MKRTLDELRMIRSYLSSKALRVLLLLLILLAAIRCSAAEAVDAAAAAQEYGKRNRGVAPVPEGHIFCEAEEFQVRVPGWRARNWGQNYYAATLANTFLSRKAFLGAPEQCEETIAEMQVHIPEAGRYLALIRFEAAYRFETRFKLQIEQNGKLVLDRDYGWREKPKIWAFGEKVTNEAAWSWGAVENVVWEGHDAWVDLQSGRATLRLIAGPQPEPAARRNVDLVMLTTDQQQVTERIEKEKYLPLDGMLTQAGDVYLRVRNGGRSALTLRVPKCREHSPYWVHMRRWQPITLEIEPGKTSQWTEVGSLLDTLNDGQWTLSASTGKEEPVDYLVEFAVQAGGRMQPIASFPSSEQQLRLVFDANTRYTRRIRRQEDVLLELVAYLKEHPVEGQPPRRTLVYAYTFNAQPENARYTAALAEFLKLMPITPREADPLSPVSGPNGYIDVRGHRGERLEEHLKELKASGLASRIASVSLGDEIGLPRPKADDHEGFQAWLKTQAIKPSEVDPRAGSDYGRIVYSPSQETAQTDPRLFYYSRRYQHAYGIEAMKPRTNLIHRYLPHAGVGANYSPHHGYFYLGETHKWVHLFREGGMTMPWSEDYVFQPPLGTQQMNFINLDLFRAGLKGHPERKIHYYVMPHWPGNTPQSWRRQFYGDLAHGMKIVDLFEFRPVGGAYTENYVNLPEMYLTVRRALYELGRFEDIVQDGRLRPGVAALWFGETSDIWNDNGHPYGAAKRALYIAALHQQLPLDVVTERDVMAGGLRDYRVLYLADRHINRQAAQALAKWVESGGSLLATAGAGLRDEFNEPLTVMEQLLGIESVSLEAPTENAVRFIKQDLPFEVPKDIVTWFSGDDAGRIPVFGPRSRFKVATSRLEGTFSDGSPAVTVRDVGDGQARYCGFLPGLSYFGPAVPRRPVDRGTTPQAMNHFIPTEFDPGAYHLVGAAATGVDRSVVCSQPLVAARVIQSRAGAAIPVVNWSAGPVKGLTVSVNFGAPSGKAQLASGRPLVVRNENEHCVYQFDLDVADAIILR